MQTKFSIWIFVASVIIIPLALYAIVNWHENRFVDLPVFGEQGHRVSEFALRDHHGDVVTEKLWDNKIVVVNFFFSHCPVICPKMMRQVKRVQLYANKKILIRSISVDPERDSVAVLKRYADKHNITQNWQLLTGSKKDIYLMARKDFLVIATDGDGGPDDFIHTDNLVLIDTKRRIRGFYKGTNEKEVDQLINDIKKLNDELK